MTLNIIEITNAYDSAEEARADWSFTLNREAMRVVERAAWHMADKYDSTRTIEREDAYQEGLALMATHPRLRECLTDPSVGLGALHTRLIQRLTHRVETEAKHRSNTKSWEVNQDQLEAMGH
ncbi:hypothetical protein [Streptomyces sp. NPDC051546]|uniref:hypothetical protein n=1 Tax=Streptomyces sp. NPDC051546 TaxID=3365655 RepID=UPI00379C9A01